MAGMAGLEPTNARVKVWCLTTWRHPNVCPGKVRLYQLKKMGWVKGFEPSTSRATIWRANQLRHTHHILFTAFSMARQEGLEPPAYCLEGSCSIQLSYWRILHGTLCRAATGLVVCTNRHAPDSPLLERVMGIEPTRPAWKAGILPLNYTRSCLNPLKNELLISSAIK